MFTITSYESLNSKTCVIHMEVNFENNTFPYYTIIWHVLRMMKQVMPLMKTLTFNVICSLIFSIKQGTNRDILVKVFEDTVRGILSVPLNLPFTRFNLSLEANAKVKSILMDLIKEERAALKQNGTSPNQDLITCLLSWSGSWLKIHPSTELVFMVCVFEIPLSSIPSYFSPNLVMLSPKGTTFKHCQNKGSKGSCMHT